MLLTINTIQPSQRKIEKIAQTLENGGIVIYPTDTAYAMGCHFQHKEAKQRLVEISKKYDKKDSLSVVFSDINHLTQHVEIIDTHIFRLLKQALPGPYTFILPTTPKTKKLLHSRRKSVGIRISDHPIVQRIIQVLKAPILTSSLYKKDDAIEEYAMDGDTLHEKFKNKVDIVVSTRHISASFSTVIDGTQSPPTLIRQGKGPWPI